MPIKPAISARKQLFHGELRFNPNGTLYREHHGPQFFGPPSKEIDRNWYNLLYASGVDINSVEYLQTQAELPNFKTWEEPIGELWRTGLDVFHQLHCLDHVRKTLDPWYYPSNAPSEELAHLHRDHCLDYIRQALMCAADLTPTHFEWKAEGHYVVPKVYDISFASLETRVFAKQNAC